MISVGPYDFESVHETRLKTGDGLDLVITAGTARLQSGQGRQTLELRFNPGYDSIASVTPLVSLTRVFNIGHAVNAGWSVTNPQWESDDYTDSAGLSSVSFPVVRCDLEVWDRDGAIQGVGFHVTTLGVLRHVQSLRERRSHDIADDIRPSELEWPETN